MDRRIILFILIVYLFLLSLAQVNTARICSVEKNALAALEDLFIATSGQSWDWKTGNGSKWSFNGTVYSDPCLDAWQGITCDGNSTQSKCAIEMLSLPQYNLRGTIPNSVASFLTNLTFLDLSYNSINGTLPDKIFQMQSLVTLNISNNYIWGSFPSIPFVNNI